MATRFSSIFQKYGDAIIQSLVGRIHHDQRTDFASQLSLEQVTAPLPDLFEELAQLLDEAAAPPEIEMAAKRLRCYPQVRFQQSCLIDEVARELTVIRDVLIDFLWREGIGATDGDLWELRDALRRTNAFIDELIIQAIVVYAASMRPRVRTRASAWPPPPIPPSRRNRI